MRQEMMGFGDGSGISWTICKQTATRSREITTTTPHRSHATWNKKGNFIRSTMASTRLAQYRRNSTQQKHTFSDKLKTPNKNWSQILLLCVLSGLKMNSTHAYSPARGVKNITGSNNHNLNLTQQNNMNSSHISSEYQGTNTLCLK